MTETIKISLSTALMRRKELMSKVKMFSVLLNANIFVPRIKRHPVHEGIDQVDGSLPKLDKEQVERELNYYSHQLRVLDQAIQQANHIVVCSVEASVMKDFVAGEDLRGTKVKETLAALLTRRKYLDEKVTETFSMDLSLLFTSFSERKKATDGMDDLLAKKETITAGEAVAKPAHYARQLRLCEDKIHETNSSTRLEVKAEVMEDYTTA